MENKVRFKLHKVKKSWVTIGVTTLSMVALAGGSLLAQGKVEADETSTPNGDGLQQLSEDGTASLVRLVKRQLLKHKTVKLPVRKWQFLHKLKLAPKKHRPLDRPHKVRQLFKKELSPLLEY